MSVLEKTALWRRYLFWFAHEHVDFRALEMESILNVLNIKVRNVVKPKEYPYWIADVKSESDVHRIASRSVTLKFCLELWSNGKTNEELHASLRNYPEQEILRYTGAKRSFKILVETFCKHFTQAEKVDKIETFSYLPTEGPVKLKDPDTTLYYVEFYGINPNDIPDEPLQLFFGRWIASGQRDLIKKLSLKTRKFIGNTSMDPQLSLIMANNAQVKSGDLVLDPFVGSGSLLVAASQFGGFIIGTDIDFMMLHGRTRPSRISQLEREEDESVAANMDQYNKRSQYIDVVVSDFSKEMWRPGFQVDAIITDPPYGIRESTEKVGTAKSNVQIGEHQTATHIPSKVGYSLPQIFKDLLNFSAMHLKIGGRLVCWFPLYRDNYSDDQLPMHPCLDLIGNSEQVLSNYTSRRLLTYSKRKEPEKSDQITTTKMKDFREEYFAVREETRKMRRISKMEERAKQREIWERNKEIFTVK